MAVEKLESWQKWLLGIVTSLIIAGIPTVVAYEIANHDKLSSIEAKVTMVSYRADKLEERDSQIALRVSTTEAELKKQAMDILSVKLKLPNPYEPRDKIP